MSTGDKDIINGALKGGDTSDGSLISHLRPNDFKALTTNAQSVRIADTKALEIGGLLPAFNVVDGDVPVKYESTFKMAPRKTEEQSHLPNEQLVALNVSGTEEIQGANAASVRIPVRPVELPEATQVVNLDSAGNSMQSFKSDGGRFQLPGNFNTGEGIRVELPQSQTDAANTKSTGPAEAVPGSSEGMAGAIIEFSQPVREVVAPNGFKYVRVEKIQWMDDANPQQSAGEQNRLTSGDEKTGLFDVNKRQNYAIPTAGSELYLIVNRDNIPCGYARETSFSDLVNSLSPIESKHNQHSNSIGQSENRSAAPDEAIQSNARRLSEGKKNLSILVDQANNHIREYSQKDEPQLAKEIGNLNEITNSGYAINKHTSSELNNIEHKRKELVGLTHQLVPKSDEANTAINKFEADKNTTTLRKAFTSAQSYEELTNIVDSNAKNLARDVHNVKNEIKADQVELQLSHYSNAVDTYHTEVKNTASADQKAVQLHDQINKVIDTPAPTEADRIRILQEIKDANVAQAKWHDAEKVGQHEIDHINQDYNIKSINDSINKPIELEADNVARVKTIDAFTDQVTGAAKVFSRDVQPKANDLVTKELTLLVDLNKLKAVNDSSSQHHGLNPSAGQVEFTKPMGSPYVTPVGPKSPDEVNKKDYTQKKLSPAPDVYRPGDVPAVPVKERPPPQMPSERPYDSNQFTKQIQEINYDPSKADSGLNGKRPSEVHTQPDHVLSPGQHPDVSINIPTELPLPDRAEKVNPLDPKASTGDQTPELHSNQTDAAGKVVSPLTDGRNAAPQDSDQPREAQSPKSKGEEIFQLKVETQIKLDLLTAATWSAQDNLNRAASDFTGLPNGRAVREEVLQRQAEMSKDPKRDYTAQYISIEDFKGINDEHGHDAGDTVLMAVAQALKQNERASDFVGHLKGDAYVNIIPTGDASQVQKAISEMRVTFKAENYRDGTSSTVIEVTGSRGEPNAFKPVRLNQDGSQAKEASEVTFSRPLRATKLVSGDAKLAIDKSPEEVVGDADFSRKTKISPDATDIVRKPKELGADAELLRNRDIQGGDLLEQMTNIANTAERLWKYDELTGLPGKEYTHFLMENEFAKTDRRKISSDYLKVDCVGIGSAGNEVMGKGPTDKLMELWAKTIKGIVGQEALVGRTGGDEFDGVILGGASETGRILDDLQAARIYATPPRTTGQEWDIHVAKPGENPQDGDLIFRLATGSSERPPSKSEIPYKAQRKEIDDRTDLQVAKMKEELLKSEERAPRGSVVYSDANGNPKVGTVEEYRKYIESIAPKRTSEVLDKEQIFEKIADSSADPNNNHQIPDLAVDILNKAAGHEKAIWMDKILDQLSSRPDLQDQVLTRLESEILPQQSFE